jgi:acetylglutamate kinase
VIVVLKVGGSSAAEAAAQVAREAEEGRALVVVHGGGPQISALMRERGLEPRYVAGRRVTDAASLACVAEGLRAVNAALCADLEAAGLRARGLPAGVVRARRVAGLGLVGEPAGADLEQVRAALALGEIPVVGPLAAELGAEGFLNVNADDAAAALAGELGADELVFLTDVPGVLDEHGALIPTVRASSPPASASGGMLPKLEAADSALSAGVLRVWIGREGTLVRA